MTDHPAFEALIEAVRAVTRPGQRYVLAVSGGPDSVALARAAASALGDASLAHVNHQARETESDQDEAFVRDLAARLGLPIHVTRVAASSNSEAEWRRQRYEALERVRTETDSAGILLGHTRDDQAETVLLNLLRGTGLRGLGGMQVVSGALVRPFLPVDRATIVEALGEIGQPYRVDRTNLDTRYRRNWLRDEILPLIETRYPAARATLVRTAALIRDDVDYLEADAEEVARSIVLEQTETSVVASIGAWRNLRPSLQRGVLRYLVKTLLGDLHDIGQREIERLRDFLEEAPAETLRDRLPRGLQVALEADHFCLSSRRPAIPAGFEAATLSVPGRLTLPHAEIVAEVWPAPDEEQARAAVVAGPMHALLDAERVGNVLTVRPRRPGDRLRPAGRGGSRKVQDLFVDRHVPRSQRDSTPIILAGDHIVWIPGIAVDERFALRDNSQPTVHLAMMPKTVV